MEVGVDVLGGGEGAALAALREEEKYPVASVL